MYPFVSFWLLSVKINSPHVLLLLLLLTLKLKLTSSRVIRDQRWHRHLDLLFSRWCVWRWLKCLQYIQYPWIFWVRNIMDLLSEPRDKDAAKFLLNRREQSYYDQSEARICQENFKKKKPWKIQNLRILKLKIFWLNPTLKYGKKP